MQKESFWRVKGVLLEGKRSPFGGQKESFWKTTVFTSENDGNFMGLGGITAQATTGVHRNGGKERCRHEAAHINF